jgi:hypothetical protein
MIPFVDYIIVIIVIYSINGKYRASYPRDGVNQMWILKNSKDILE